MSHFYSKIWIHVIFGTKHRVPLITEDFELGLHAFIREQLIEQKCIPIAVNGMSEHLHVLFGMHPEKSVSGIVQRIKGASSHWINSNMLPPVGFRWQVGYGAFSVSDTMLQKVQFYVDHQKEHHRASSLIAELERTEEPGKYQRD
jgi:putative transposase